LFYFSFNYVIVLHFFFFSLFALYIVLHSFPTRRSSDLGVLFTKGYFFYILYFNVMVFNDLFCSLPIIFYRLMLIVLSQPDCCARSEEHTSELQSREKLVCRLLLEKKKIIIKNISIEILI